MKSKSIFVLISMLITHKYIHIWYRYGPQCYSATVPQCHGATVPQCHLATVPQCHGATVLQSGWDSGGICTGFHIRCAMNYSNTSHARI